MSSIPTAIARRLINFKELRAIGIGFSREHLWRLEAKAQFPRRVKLGSQKTAWFEDEVLAWLEQRSAERAERTYRPHD
jgi:prophage regulatory protein